MENPIRRYNTLIVSLFNARKKNNFFAPYIIIAHYFNPFVFGLHYEKHGKPNDRYGKNKRNKKLNTEKKQKIVKKSRHKAERTKSVNIACPKNH